MKILYFTTDFSAQNIAFAQNHNMTLRLANATESSQNLEPCDFVFGDETPENYRAKFPFYELPQDTHSHIAELETENATLKQRIAELETEIAQINEKSTKSRSKKTDNPE